MSVIVPWPVLITASFPFAVIVRSSMLATPSRALRSMMSVPSSKSVIVSFP